ncbi:alpha/beta hydrolase [Granulicella sibirica]|uniref:Alpha/beta hydrolase fold-3 domain protein n=1 Tax=Granulicella sibirica TaxID=2479048 RepID=A0A4Q0T2L9_9BACT|nr:alpha/beta hydrolase [Granulicella sibirica]RXH56670.1 Alpha/beta hydrolase fold-3 domain protein [Granulicella sibirica]
MQTLQKDQTTAPWLVEHPLSADDQAAMDAMRVIVDPNKGKLQGIAARDPFDSIMEHVSAPAGVVYEANQIGGVSGWWCRPEGARPGEAIMHIHGGWFNWGSAQAFRHLAGHIAISAGVVVFLPDYRLAPEHPFPAAAEDIRACYAGLIAHGFSKVGVTGDSAGGNLALELLVHLATDPATGSAALIGGVALSPVTDLTLSGDSWSTRAVDDPYFTKPQAAELVRSYLDGHSPEDPLVSPLFADLKGLAPIRVHVGTAEVLLDDSVRFVERAITAGVDARLDVWEGMAHGHLGAVGRLAASAETLQLIGHFLSGKFTNAEA